MQFIYIIRFYLANSLLKLYYLAVGIIIEVIFSFRLAIVSRLRSNNLFLYSYESN